MRNYLRYQSDNIKSVNIVKEVISYLEVLYTNIDEDSIKLVTQVLDTLNEFSMGNLENQHLLFDKNGKPLLSSFSSLTRVSQPFPSSLNFTSPHHCQPHHSRAEKKVLLRQG